MCWVEGGVVGGEDGVIVGFVGFLEEGGGGEREGGM